MTTVKSSTRKATQQSWWRKFFTPGWIFTAVLIVLFSYLAFTFLAPWQLGKDDAIVERNNRIEQAFEVDPVPVSEVVNPDGTYDRADEWTRVTLAGRYLPQAEVLLRLRPVDSVPAFQSLVPFLLNSGQAILVNRGWVRAIDGTKVSPIAPPPTGQVTLTGLVRVDEGVHPKPPLESEDFQQVHSINTGQISEITGVDLAEPWVMLTDEQPGVLTPLPLPMLERGNHLSYGLQWIAFGIMAPLGLLYFIWAELKERRRVREEDDELAAAESTSRIDDTAQPDPPPPEGVSVTTTSSAQAQRMRNRYGDSRRNLWARNTDRDEERI
ncbi:SURF1 family cytochrome oxidase biogenesis protein [Corynebacterium cystitidis]|uniref:SURF1-like protein n=1 Tax=Corynebacterium cystitidis DSM 20524 TaxID=1121357 RepID=A0A1H9VNW6_9CORY|nr:SURF1 family protein [Corynebacterium cystitidis]WJY82871.1 SURF1 family protein [Corynebacterium cystitidis DSM 20524]SES23375.1 Cytochrome oxidase assembly protein ShyY1 [Corynebacterium cystitidis DSM 20524]SNV69568.1 Uncharacterized conserved protein [Corynebacterium cystitidis]